MSTAAIRYIQFYPENIDFINPIFQPEDWEMGENPTAFFCIC
jgi:hypothetical protein